MNTNQIAHTAALMGEPARTAMLLALMDGRALTARELAVSAHVSPATASRHLAMLLEAGFLQMEKQGRHRYHRLASAEVAALIESLMQLSAPALAVATVVVQTGPRDQALRTARLCYDHLAGRLGIAIADHLVEASAVVLQGNACVLPGAGLQTALQRLGMVAGVDGLKARGARPVCLPCLDWSERRPHLAGQLGALICGHCMAQGWLLRCPGSRALRLSEPGARALRDWVGTARWRGVTAT
ncbi:helix-turn-helix transcriptional regulator [Hydrogenophaga sp. PAMC20947]|uniref:ArsR/SmtB family transcription factor n=1 Tax=Hydrogenophaga sp. PAMC20947 TaxID=2565558 RepID=UPI00109DCCEA|nr:helix-turn-helix transcriptional regulator [Hydrogenophaga sp. PAMC20947]QCB46242.1 transcriptional regulator [Hydrogenophaga sp. PAMC20947]